MKLSKHIGIRVCQEKEFRDTIIEKFSEQHAPNKHYEVAKTILNIDCRTFYITESVINQLDLLKIKKYDWALFKNIPKLDATYLLPDNFVIRVARVGDKILFFALKVRPSGDADLVVGDKLISAISPSDNMDRDDVERIVYHLFCFIHFAENEEIIVNAGGKLGTKKSGKVLNDTKVNVTLVNSRWGKTVIHNEEFMVSGHFRLQPVGAGRSQTKVIWIDPYKKDSYTRTYQ